MSGKTRSRKMGSSPILTKEDEKMLLYSLEDIVNVGYPLNPSQFKMKVEEMTQARMTPFKQRIPSKSCLR